MSELDICQCGHIRANHEPENDLIGNGHLPCVTCSCGGYTKNIVEVRQKTITPDTEIRRLEKEGWKTEALRNREIMQALWRRIADLERAKEIAFKVVEPLQSRLEAAEKVVEAAQSVIDVTKNKMCWESLPFGQREYLDELAEAVDAYAK